MVVMVVDEILEDLPDVKEDIAEALHLAAETVRERELPMRPNMRFLHDEGRHFQPGHPAPGQ